MKGGGGPLNTRHAGSCGAAAADMPQSCCPLLLLPRPPHWRAAPQRQALSLSLALSIITQDRGRTRSRCRTSVRTSRILPRCRQTAGGVLKDHLGVSPSAPSEPGGPRGQRGRWRDAPATACVQHSASRSSHRGSPGGAGVRTGNAPVDHRCREERRGHARGVEASKARGPRQESVVPTPHHHSADVKRQ